MTPPTGGSICGRGVISEAGERFAGEGGRVQLCGGCWFIEAGNLRKRSAIPVTAVVDIIPKFFVYFSSVEMYDWFWNHVFWLSKSVRGIFVPFSLITARGILIMFLVFKRLIQNCRADLSFSAGCRQGLFNFFKAFRFSFAPFGGLYDGVIWNDVSWLPKSSWVI